MTGVLETGFSTFGLLVAIRAFESSETWKGLLSGGGFGRFVDCSLGNGNCRSVSYERDDLWSVPNGIVRRFHSWCGPGRRRG